MKVNIAGSSVLLVCLLGGSIIILQNPHARAIEIIKLSTIHRTKKNPQRDKYDDDRQRYQQVERFHQCAFRKTGGMRSSRKALTTTNAELSDMPNPAIHGVSNPNAAAGMASRL